MTDRAHVIRYWQKFFADLLLGTFLYLFLFSAGGVCLGLMATGLLNSGYIIPSGWSVWLDWLVFLVALGWQGLFGWAHGLIACTLWVAGKKLKEALLGLHDLLDILANGVVASYPNLDRQTPKKELEEKFEKLGHKFLEDLKLKGGPISFAKRMIFLVILKILKFFFINDFLEEIRKKNKDDLSRADIESAVRRVGVDILLSPLTDYLFILHGVNGVALLGTLGLPFFLFWIF